jgi:AraC-like DNA-binding protein
MQVLYDTRRVHPLDRYEYYRAGAGVELAPVAIDGGPLPDLLAVLSMIQVGDFTIELVTGAAAAPVVARRTERLIRARDPECYRIFVTVSAEVQMVHAGNQALIRERDIALFDLSRPWRTTHPVGTLMRLIMLSFPRTLVPITGSSVRPLLGTTIPRSLPGRSLVAQTLIELTTTNAGEPIEIARPDVIQECTVGLIRHWLGQPARISPRTRRLLYLARIRAIIRQHLDNPTLDPGWIADAAHISPRYLHTIFQHAELPLMQLVKRMRLEECHRKLHDPALLGLSIKDIISGFGYRRPDQFARDFKQLYGASAREIRQLAKQRRAAARR